MDGEVFLRTHEHQSTQVNVTDLFGTIELGALELHRMSLTVSLI